MARLLLQRGADADKTSRFGDKALDDCKDERMKRVILQKSTGDVACTATGSYASGGLGRLPTRLLEHVFGLLDARALGTAATVDGRCHRVCESKTLWQALGVARWELAVRASVREQAGGFSVAPLLATYRPSSSSNKNKSSRDRRQNCYPIVF